MASKPPSGVAAMLAALLPTIQIWYFSHAGSWTSEEFIVHVLIFVGLWLLPGAVLLMLLARNPHMEALWAGAIVAIAMLLVGSDMLRPHYGSTGVFWGNLAFVVIVFGSLAMGCSAIAGLVASWFQRRRERSFVHKGRVSAVVALVTGAPILIGGLLMLSSGSAIALLTTALGLLMVCAGWTAMPPRRTKIEDLP